MTHMDCAGVVRTPVGLTPAANFKARFNFFWFQAAEWCLADCQPLQLPTYGSSAPAAAADPAAADEADPAADPAAAETAAAASSSSAAGAETAAPSCMASRVSMDACSLSTCLLSCSFSDSAEPAADDDDDGRGRADGTIGGST